VYLLTGGLGGIGLALARYLAKQFRARLVLTTRSALPPPGEYEQWLRLHAADDATSGRIRAVRELQEAGAEVQVVQADVADFNQMKAVFELTQARFGALHGVIHCAGVPGGGLVQLKDAATAAAVLAPKVQGTLVLAELARHQSLDFLLLCSSLTALFGGAGQVDYTAANAFVDAFAQAERGRGGLPAIAVNWDGWHESGMAVKTEVPAELQEARRQDLRLGLSDVDGVEAFRRVLAAGLPQVAVSTRDLAARMRRAERPAAATADAPPAASAAVPGGRTHARPALSTEYVAPRDELEQSITGICQELLGVAPLGVHDNFFELGAHSLLALRMIARLNEALGVELPPNRFFEAPTVAQLAEKAAALRVSQAAEDAQLTELMQLVENMSDEEVRTLLAQEG
jgi:NAD(P)-dependent dehydrogenase (short-subunit alcohol dehydrogenase family)